MSELIFKHSHTVSDSRVITDQTYLRQKSRNTSLSEVEKYNIVNRIKEALKYSWVKGFGLASIQIGIPLSVVWYRCLDKNKKEVVEKLLINPKIIKKSKELFIATEGCLSIPDTSIITQRHVRITVIDDNVFKTETEIDGVESYILQHEIDHINGILCVDRKNENTSKIGRNMLCSCGSGKKYKKCCGK